MRDEVVIPGEPADYTCEECGKDISPQQAEISMQSTYEIGGSDGRTLCRKHHDRETRVSRAAQERW